MSFIPFNLANIFKCSNTVKSSHKQSYYGHMPIDKSFDPFIIAIPLDYSTKSIKIFIKVDFPAPLGPITPKISPFFS